MPRGKSVAKMLLDSSQAALFAGIEIHNKPHIAFRYQTATILIVTAWELAIKAYVYKHVGKKQLFEAKSGHTKSFSKVLSITENHINGKENNKKFQAVVENLKLLNEYRNSTIHFGERKLDPILFMLMSRAVLNYSIFVKKYFQRDITKDDDLIILPVGFKLPFDPIEYLKQDYGGAHNEFVNQVIQSVRNLNEVGVQDSIVVGFNIVVDRVREVKNADIIASIEKDSEAVALRKTIRITNDPNAPEYRVEPDLPPLRYWELVDLIKERKPDIKINKLFHQAMQKVKSDPMLCRPNYLDPDNKKGTKKDFYAMEAIEVLIKEYERLESLV